MAFTHLHLHTEYSLLDGMAKIDSVVAQAKELGMDSLAITDHGAMFGVIDFYKECMKTGIKPIIGCEVYVAPRTMEDKDPALDRYPNHLVLLAENNAGYKNLIKLVSLGYIDGYYYKPRIDKETLRQHNKGLIALSACLAGRVQELLLRGDIEKAEEEALELNEIFGQGNFFLELQDQGLEEEQIINPMLVKMARKTGIPLVATNDVHYVRKEDAENHDVLLAIQTATTIDDEKRMRFPNDQFYLKTEDEMRKIFAYAPDAIDNTSKIAERCDVTFSFGKYHLPEFKVPDGMTKRELLRDLCREGLKERYPGSYEDKKERMEYELSVIESMGYVEYFLIVWDFIRYAKSRGIPVGPGRGSAAGSLVAYSLRITDIDPIKYNLIFERFLNPERVSMPDIDVDFCIERREEVIDYVKEKYGKNNVAQIVTFGRLKARQAIRDVGRALKLSYPETDRAAKAIPNLPGMTLDKALKTCPDLIKQYEENPLTKKVIDTAKALEGMPRNVGTHAAGIVISKLPLDEYVPLYCSDKGIATAFTMNTIEELGLLKMDFLGLRNLTLIHDACSLIKENGGPDIDFSKMSMDDKEVYEMIARGMTQGVFQLESSGMTDFMKSLKPSCFEDIVAGISLYRPGPMDSIPKYIENKKDPSKIKYVTPELAPILDVTYGCMVYQEQVMQIVRDLAGYSYGRSDLVRRAMSKKKQDVMAEEKEWFIYGKSSADGEVEIPGCIRNGISEEAAEVIFNDMSSFAEYAFNKSHAAAYAVLAYQTAYLKHYYPVEFMASLMSSVMGESDQVAKYIAACRKMGIEVLPPCINESKKKFSGENGKIRFGLLAVKNVGEAVIDEIIRVREEKTKPHDIFSFINGLDTNCINKKAMESLIKAGALDCLEGNRTQKLAVYEELIDSAQKNARKNISGQLSLFQLDPGGMETGDTVGKLPDLTEFDKDVLLAMEKEMTGVYITDHPLNRYRQKLEEVATVTSAEIEELAKVDPAVGDDTGSEFGSEPYPDALPEQKPDCKDGDDVVIGGMVSSVRRVITKRKQMMAFIKLEDLFGSVELVVFPDIYERCIDLLSEGSIIVSRGKLDIKEDGDASVLVEHIVSIEEAEKIKDYARGEQSGRSGKGKARRRRANGDVKIRIPPEGSRLGRAGRMDDKEAFDEVITILGRHRGKRPVLIYLRNGKIVTSEDYRVRASLDFAEEMALLVGNPNIRIKEIDR